MCGVAVGSKSHVATPAPALANIDATVRVDWDLRGASTSHLCNLCEVPLPDALLHVHRVVSMRAHGTFPIVESVRILVPHGRVAPLHESLGIARHASPPWHVRSRPAR